MNAFEVLSCPRFWERSLLRKGSGDPSWVKRVEMQGLVTLFRTENLLLHLFTKGAGLLPGARPEAVPLKGTVEGAAFREPSLVVDSRWAQNTLHVLQEWMKKTRD